jgi:ABC-type sugar transport system permease subunit
MQPSVIENDPPIGIALSIFWGFTWRTFVWVLALLIPAAILIFGLSFVINAHTATQDEASQISALTGILLGWLMGASATFVALRGMIGKKFGGYRLILAKDQAVDGTAWTGTPAAV